MSASRREVREALRALLLNVSGVAQADVHWERESFNPEPDRDKPYVKENLLVAGNAPASSCLDMAQGIYQLDVVYPTGMSTLPIDTLVTALEDVFYSGKVGTKGSTCVHIDDTTFGAERPYNPQQREGTSGTAWLAQTLRVSWRVHAVRSNG